MCERLVRAAVRVAPVTEQRRRRGIGRLGGRAASRAATSSRRDGKLHVRSPRGRGRAAAAAAQYRPAGRAPWPCGSRRRARRPSGPAAGQRRRPAPCPAAPARHAAARCERTPTPRPRASGPRADHAPGRGVRQGAGPTGRAGPGQGLGQQAFCLVHAAEPTKQHDAQVPHLQLVRACSQSRRRTFERQVVAAMPGVDDRHLVTAGGNPRVQPCGLCKGGICLVITAQPDQRQTEQVVGSAVFGVGIEGRQPCTAACRCCSASSKRPSR